MIPQHPLKILTFSAKNLWLLIFPLARGLWAIRFDLTKLYDWFKGAWFDILIIILILLIGYIRWKFSFIQITNKTVTYCNGVIFKTHTQIPYENISAVTIERNPIYRVINAANVKIDTSAGILNRPDMKFLIKFSDVPLMENNITAMENTDGIRYSYKPEWKIMLFFSFLFSSSFSGAVYLASLFFQFSKIIESIINRKLTDTLNEVTGEAARRLALGIPPFVFSIALIIIISWAISFIRNIFRYLHFRIEKNSSSIKINMGLLKKYVYYLVFHKINYVDLRQNLIMKIFGVMSVNINCSGYGDEKSEMPVFVPIMKKEQVPATLRIFMANSITHKNKIKPGFSKLFRYVWQPATVAVAFYAIALSIMHRFPQYAETIRLMLIMTEIPAIWLVIIKSVSLFTTSVSIENNQLCIRCCKLYAFHTILADADKIAKISFKQNPIQKKFGNADLIFHLNSESVKKIVVKAMPKKKIEELFSL